MLFEDWALVAESAVAQFRAATGHLIADERWRALIDRVRDASPEFAAMWERHDLADHETKEKTVRHASLGRLRFVYASIAPDRESPGVRIVTYMPAEPRTSAALREPT